MTHEKPTETIVWWGLAFEARPFLLVSLALFACWTLVGCYREMRVELKMRNSPLVWLGFLVFIGVYVSGFGNGIADEGWALRWAPDAVYLALAALTFGAVTYAMVLLEPKDRVLYRWLAEAIGSGNIAGAFASLQGWMMSYGAAVACAAALIAWELHRSARGVTQAALVVSAAGLLTRDVSIFLLFQTLPGWRRGDFASVVTLVALYALVPAILDGLDLKNALPLFFVRPSDPIWLGPAVIWAEAAVVAASAFARIMFTPRQSAALPA